MTVFGRQDTIEIAKYRVGNFSPEIPEFSKESCVNGWKFLLRENLPDYLRK